MAEALNKQDKNWMAVGGAVARLNIPIPFVLGDGSTSVATLADLLVVNDTDGDGNCVQQW